MEQIERERERERESVCTCNSHSHTAYDFFFGYVSLRGIKFFFRVCVCVVCMHVYMCVRAFVSE